MFGKNEIVGRRFFKDAAAKLLVTSMFVTLQGEGPLRGEPAFFVRLSKCNLACRFCDTYFDSGDWYTLDELDEAIDRAIEKFFEGNVPEWAQKGPDKKRQMALVLTGGEPLLQNIFPFLERMNRQFTKTQIESNGLVAQPIPDETILVVSPKCLEKDGKAIKYLNPHPTNLKRANCLKFVMEANFIEQIKSDYRGSWREEILKDTPYSSIPEWAFEWRNTTDRPIFISPMNIYNQEPQRAKALRATKNDISIEERSTVDEVISFWEPGLLNMPANQRNHEYAAKYCVQHGLILNLQIHLYASLA